MGGFVDLLEGRKEVNLHKAIYLMIGVWQAVRMLIIFIVISTYVL